MSALDWAFEIQDRMSAPLTKIGGKLDSLLSPLKKAERDIARLNIALKQKEILDAKTPLEAMQKTLEVNSLKAKALDDSVTRLSSSFKAVTLAVTAGAGALAYFGKKLVEGKIESTEFKETSLRNLKAILGEQGPVQEYYDLLSKVSSGTTMSRGEIFKQFDMLVTEGLNAKNAMDVLTAASDLSLTRGSDAGQKYLSIFQKTLASKQDFDKFGRGFFSDESFKELRSLGPDFQNQFLKQIAAQHKTTERGARQLIVNGLIRPQEALMNLFDLPINNVNGGQGVGFASSDIAAKSTTIQLKNLQENFSKLMESGTAAPLAEALGRINALLDPTTESGKKMQVSLNKAFNTLARLIEGINIDDITRGMQLFGDAAKSVADTFTVVATILPPVLNGLIGFGELLLSPFTAFFGEFALWVDDVSALFEAKRWFDLGMMIPTGIIQGLEAGIIGTMGTAIDAVARMGRGTIETFKGVLGIKSPSRVFAQLGAYTGQGFVMGLEGTPQADISGLLPSPASMALPSVDRASIPSPASMGTAGGRGNTSVSIEVNVNATGAMGTGEGSPQAIGDATAQAVRRELVSFFESMGA